MEENIKGNSMPFNPIEEVIEDIKNGKIVIMVDDEHRENERRDRLGRDGALDGWSGAESGRGVWMEGEL